MSLQTIVNVQITRGSRTITRAGFGTMLFLGSGATFPERFRVYSSLTAVAVDFLSSTNEYKAASKYFGQERKPRQIMIGKRLAAVAQVNTVTVLNNTPGSFTVTINGVAFTYVAVAETITQIKDALVALINAGAEPVTALSTGASTFSLTADVAGNSFTSLLTVNMSQVITTANHGIAEDLQDIVSLPGGNDWYTLAIETRTNSDILNAAAYIETVRKVFGVASSEANIKTGLTTDIASLVKAKSYTRTFVFYSADQANYPEAALFGVINPLDPGSYTAKFKTLVGIVADDLNDSELSFIKAKFCNYYTKVAGVDIFQEGTVSMGEYIDTIIFIDWLQAQIEEGVFADLINNPKIPFTDIGGAVLEKQVRAQLQKGIRFGGLAADPAPTVTVPKVADIDPLDRQARIFKTIEFAANLAGAIHFTEIRGVVSV